MKRPKKKLEFQADENPEGLKVYLATGYNQACDDWEKYHNWILQRILSELKVIAKKWGLIK